MVQIEDDDFQELCWAMMESWRAICVSREMLPNDIGEFSSTEEEHFRRGVFRGMEMSAEAFGDFTESLGFNPEELAEEYEEQYQSDITNGETI